jgi:6-phosphogluconate dehydrogenase
MPGGDREAYEQIRPIWEAIAAKVDDGPCVTYIGPGGAGHFVKMVHNGIEYGDMQLIAEAYDLMRTVIGMEATEMADVFDEWNRGDLESFLIEITAQILRVKDPRDGQARSLTSCSTRRGRRARASGLPTSRSTSASSHRRLTRPSTRAICRRAKRNASRRRSRSRAGARRVSRATAAR